MPLKAAHFSSVGFSLRRKLIVAVRGRNEEAKECVGLCTAGLWPAFLNLGFARTANTNGNVNSPAGGQRYERQLRQERCRAVRQALAISLRRYVGAGLPAGGRLKPTLPKRRAGAGAGGRGRWLRRRRRWSSLG